MISVEQLCNVHTHLREGEQVMQSLITLAIQGGANVLLPMPNTKDGLTTYRQVLDYVELAKTLTPANSSLTFLPTSMLTEETPETEIRYSVQKGIMDAKVYPRDRTTRSGKGVKDYDKLVHLLNVCGEVGMRVHLHPEHPWMTFGNRDAEFVFLSIMYMLLRQTSATFIWEHGTDGRCVPFWKEMAKTGRFFVTLTAHHLVSNEDQAFGDVRSVCKPPHKTELDRLALIQLVQEDNFWVMAGGDDAPHDITAKHVHEGQCACGAYTGPFLLQLYAHALKHLLTAGMGSAGWYTFVNFTSRNARRLCKLPDQTRNVLLDRRDFFIPKSYQVGPWTVEPFWAGRKIDYCMLYE